MGWLWSDSPSKASSEAAHPIKDFSPDAKPSPDTSTASIPPKGEDSSDPELADFLKAIEAESNPSPKAPVYVRRPKPSPNTASTDTPSDLPISEHLLPTTMSCREAFDSAFYCNSLGGQWNSVYRSGNMRKCSDHWSDFWFCMRTRTYGKQAKEKAIRDYYREKERLKYGRDNAGEDGGLGRSSEDVWKSRDRLVERGTEMRSEWPLREGKVGPIESDVS